MKGEGVEVDRSWSFGSSISDEKDVVDRYGSKLTSVLSSPSAGSTGEKGLERLTTLESLSLGSIEEDSILEEKGARYVQESMSPDSASKDGRDRYQQIVSLSMTLSSGSDNHNELQKASATTKAKVAASSTRSILKKPLTISTAFAATAAGDDANHAHGHDGEDIELNSPCSAASGLTMASDETDGKKNNHNSHHPDLVFSPCSVASNNADAHNADRPPPFKTFKSQHSIASSDSVSTSARQEDYYMTSSMSVDSTKPHSIHHHHDDDADHNSHNAKQQTLQDINGDLLLGSNSDSPTKKTQQPPNINLDDQNYDQSIPQIQSSCSAGSPPTTVASFIPGIDSISTKNPSLLSGTNRSLVVGILPNDSSASSFTGFNVYGDNCLVNNSSSVDDSTRNNDAILLDDSLVSPSSSPTKAIHENVLGSPRINENDNDVEVNNVGSNETSSTLFTEDYMDDDGDDGDKQVSPSHTATVVGSEKSETTNSIPTVDNNTETKTEAAPAPETAEETTTPASPSVIHAFVTKPQPKSNSKWLHDWDEETASDIPSRQSNFQSKHPSSSAARGGTKNNNESYSPPSTHNGGHYPNNNEEKNFDDDDDGIKEEDSDCAPLGSYLKHMEDMQKEAVERIHTSWALDNPCQTLSNLEHTWEEAIQDMNCQQMIPFLHQHPTNPQEQQPVYSRDVPIGPSKCEYCGSQSTKNCSDEYCHRPKLYFLKKKSPFHTWDGWNKKTEYRIDSPFGMSSTEKKNDLVVVSGGDSAGSRKMVTVYRRSGNSPRGENGHGGGGVSGDEDNDVGWTSSFMGKFVSSPSWGGS